MFWQLSFGAGGVSFIVYNVIWNMFKNQNVQILRQPYEWVIQFSSNSECKVKSKIRIWHCYKKNPLEFSITNPFKSFHNNGSKFSVAESKVSQIVQLQTTSHSYSALSYWVTARAIARARAVFSKYYSWLTK